MTKKVLVVGGAGYIGGALTDLLKNSQIKFSVYDNLLYENTFFKDVDFIFGDVRDKQKLKSILNKYDTVIWLAAIVGDGACAANPTITKEVNEDSVKWLCENFNGRIIFPSTCSVYGANKEHGLTEESKTNPLSLYAETKLNCEKVLSDRGNCAIFRLGTLHGMGDRFARPRLDLVINILTMKAVNKEVLTVFGGEQWRPVVHVKDVAEAFYNTLLDKPEWKNLNGIYNLHESNVEINYIANMLKVFVPDCIINKVDMKFEDLRDYNVSGYKLQKDLGIAKWIPKWNIESSINQLVNIYESNRIKDPSLSIFHNQRFLEELEENRRLYEGI